jgi:drug/metabolite transporter (DMT)-like permease
LPFNAIRLWMSVGLWFALERTVPTAKDLPRELVVGAGLAGFFGPFLSRLGALKSAQDVPARVTSFASLTTPLMTLLLAFLVLRTLPTERELLGGAILLVGVAVPLLAHAREREAGSD